MSKKKRPTWADLKAYCATLNDDQLRHPITIWGEERGAYVDYIEALKEDHIQPDQYCEPVSVYAEDMTPEELAAEPRVAFKGQPILHIDASMPCLYEGCEEDALQSAGNQMCVGHSMMQ